MRGRTLCACAGDPGFPVGFVLVEATRRHTAFRNVRPRLVRAGKLGDHTPGRNRNPAALTLFIFSHAEIAGRFRRRGRISEGLCGGKAN